MKHRGWFLRGARPFWIAALFFVTLLLAPAGHAQEPEEPLVTAVRPAEGWCGTQVMLTIYGSNFEPASSVFIPEGVETIYTEFISPEELQAKVVIVDDAPPGPRPVHVAGPELGYATLEEGFIILCQGPIPEGRADLALVGLRSDIVEEGRLLVIIAQIENAGDAPAPEATLHAESQIAGWWAADAVVPALNPGDGVEVLIRLEIPDELRGRSHPFGVGVEPREEIAEWSADNNWGEIEVWVSEPEERRAPTPSRREEPTPGPGPGPDDSTLTAVVAVVVVITVGGVTLTIRRTVDIRRRKEWQDKSTEEEPPEPCQHCTRHCQKIEIEAHPAGRKITHLTFIASDPASGETTQERQMKGEVVHGLNDAIGSARRKESPDELRSLVASVAEVLLQQVGEWLRGEPAPQDASFGAHLAGGKLTCEFILSHCQRRGNVNVWVEEKKWKATVDEERDEPIITLRRLDPTEPEMPKQAVTELTQRLMHFIEEFDRLR